MAPLVHNLQFDFTDSRSPCIDDPSITMLDLFRQVLAYEYASFLSDQRTSVLLRSANAQLRAAILRQRGTDHVNPTDNLRRTVATALLTADRKLGSFDLPTLCRLAGIAIDDTSETAAVWIPFLTYCRKTHLAATLPGSRELDGLLSRSPGLMVTPCLDHWEPDRGYRIGFVRYSPTVFDLRPHTMGQYERDLVELPTPDVFGFWAGFDWSETNFAHAVSRLACLGLTYESNDLAKFIRNVWIATIIGSSVMSPNILAQSVDAHQYSIDSHRATLLAKFLLVLRQRDGVVFDLALPFVALVGKMLTTNSIMLTEFAGVINTIATQDSIRTEGFCVAGGTFAVFPELAQMRIQSGIARFVADEEPATATEEPADPTPAAEDNPAPDEQSQDKSDDGTTAPPETDKSPAIIAEIAERQQLRTDLVALSESETLSAAQRTLLTGIVRYWFNLLDMQTLKLILSQASISLPSVN